MWQSEGIGSLHWHCQSPTGCHHGHSTYACSVGIADGYEQESNVELRVWPWYSVRQPSFVFPPPWYD